MRYRVNSDFAPSCEISYLPQYNFRLTCSSYEVYSSTSEIIAHCLRTQNMDEEYESRKALTRALGKLDGFQLG